MMKTTGKITSAMFALALMVASPLQANTPAYETLEQYCVAVEADTPENCACGQAKAEQLMTAEERRLVLGLISDDPKAKQQFMELGPKGQQLMQKFNQVTQGCDG